MKPLLAAAQGGLVLTEVYSMIWRRRDTGGSAAALIGANVHVA